MANFQWRGTDARGREQRGECAASGLVDAASQVRAQGVAPIAVDRVDADPAVPFSITADAFTTFNRNLAEMTSLGLPLGRAVREIASGLRRGRFKAALDRVEAELREGRTLDEAVAKVPEAFPSDYRSMLKAGAVSGNLPAVLSAIARNTEGRRYARRALLEAVAYPLLVILIAVLFIGCFIAFYVPFFREMFTEARLEPPLTLQILFRMFDSARTVIAVVVGGLALAGVGWAVLRRTVAGDRVLRRLPLIGRIRTHLSTARLLGTLGILLRTNTPLPSALRVAIGATGSREQAHEVDRLVALAAEGIGLDEVLARIPGLPAHVAAYLGLAERTGDAPGAAGEVALLLTEQAAAESEYLFMVLMPAALFVAGAFVSSILIPVVTGYVGFLERLHP